MNSSASASHTSEPDTGTTPSSWPARVKAKVLAYIALTKPRVIELLLVSTIPVMLQADRGHVSIGLILITVIGGWMGAASANSLNMVADADIDQKMKRTQRRPLARHAVPVRNVLIFGLVLAAASFVTLYYGTANAAGERSFLPSILVMITIGFYVFVYTLILKRRTWQNVIWGGAAGCMPALIGWAAVTHTLSWQPFVLFLVVFFWTPPHTWALAWRYRDDYAAAGVPMLPVVATPEQVTRQMLIYTWLTVLTSLFLIPVTSWVYLTVAVGSGAWFIWYVTRLYIETRRGVEVRPLKIFLVSNEYLALLFCGLAVDAVFDLPTLVSYF
ncbi:protoheme IX farnesyltransferase [Gordonia hirsuta DSM 44140 = NBRC 16056]|uniref:Protoheme IX farnesyltransferase n=1 Tax=Gordonia hirsuta DSM 44140 = NBRC 16056 TaxID=1121927 RepID=L7L810_9ACTN|nr:heme o synthase [Gordonia hirsuta]GAC57290.1 protoheme IX farnesyltransferase [Gordonia hirsuta DSM 44140 = NBRC 16056]